MFEILKKTSKSMKKNKLAAIVFLSFVVSMVAFFTLGYISGESLPYQDPSPELEKQYDEYVKNYDSIWYISLIIFSISFITFISSSVKLIIKMIKKNTNEDIQEI
jgi:hypothetical protein